VYYQARWSGPHRISARYTHTKADPRPGKLIIDGEAVATLAMPSTPALPAWSTASTEVNLSAGRHVIRLSAINAGGLPNMDYIKVAEIREYPPGMRPRIQILEAEDGAYSGKEDHHSCWNFIAQQPGPHSGFTGEGYVDSHNKTGSYLEVEWTAPQAGEYELSVRYVHGKTDTRPAKVEVNGTLANASLPFTGTGTWTAWSTRSTPVQLKRGKNVVRLTALGPQGLVNIDHLAFRLKPQ
jgi:hypothetical protein